MFTTGIDRGPTRRLVATDRTAGDHRHPRFHGNLGCKLRNGKTVGRSLARTDDRERRRREHLRVAAHEQRLGYIRELQNGIWKQRITGMQLVPVLVHH